MKHDPVYQRLREIAWRRKLTDSEQAELHAWLAIHPEAEAEHRLESAVNDALRRIPDAPVPSNFTARVVQAIEREERQATRNARDWNWIWRVLVPRTAAAMLVVGAGVIAYEQIRDERRARTTESIKTVLGVTVLPSPEVLEDFDVIRRLDAVPAADQELIALLQ